MKEPAEQLSVDFDVIPATSDQAPILANLLELYAHDFSEFLELDLGTDGRFGYKNLPLYWSEPSRHPFLVKIGGKLGGFVLVKTGSEISGNQAVWDMAEFFVIRGCRRRGVGTRIAHEVWRRLPGTWEVRVMQSNVPAFQFWAHAISKFTDKPAEAVQVEKDGEGWQVFSFKSGRVP